ncbi:MAG: flagellar hook protein FlgE [Sulfuritalea sp.]|jgi:flagellar hook protein FlgE|nr:flagellar hook protein FlgE [Sulfuritalea sp.]
MGFQQGLSGLNSSSKSLDTIGNNIANSGTVGFKNGSTQFADVFAASLSGAGAAPVGIGAKVAGIVQQFSQGNISVTNNPLDTAINGGGFFQMDDGSGGTVYSRNGQFQLDKDGFIVSAQGLQLKGIAAVNGVIATGSPATPLRLFDPTQSLSGTPQMTGGSTSASGIQANINLDSRLGPPVKAPFDYGDPTSYNQSTATTIYDSLGNPHTYSMYFVKDAAANTWNVYATLTNPAGSTPPNPPSTATFQDLSFGGVTSVGQLVFDESGTLTSLPFTVANGNAPSISDTDLGYPSAVLSPQTFALDFSGSTQYGAQFAVNAMLQDGFASGTLAGFNIGKDGVVLGRYTNGQTKPVGQVVLASFRNPQGLQPLGDNRWAQSPTSGDPITAAPGSSGQYGVLQSSGLEDSNVDLTAELVNMITQQRAYQANAQTIKTQDSILQTLVNLR